MAKKGVRRISVSGDRPRMVGGTEAGRMQEVSRGISQETERGRVNDREAVRLAIGNHPRAHAVTIVKTLQSQGVSVSRALVENVQEQMRGGGPATGLTGGGRPKREKGRKGATTDSKRTRGDGLT
jgi:hypothetical protein